MFEVALQLLKSSPQLIDDRVYVFRQDLLLFRGEIMHQVITVSRAQ